MPMRPRPLKLSNEARALHALSSGLARHADFYERHPDLREKTLAKIAALRAGAKVKYWVADNPFVDKETNPIAIVARMIPRTNRNTKGKRIPQK